ncbi:hypothetical protein M422DRAFT_51650 [Sphaerobolus stellatus SS14]|uniref:Unplaced genomic scaffold SPHSTscaffold_118, whole genome shotgun sequence n=1 Tax=Sphaerobolus stellatus (strain SS14) TaxID=990650 RepID=A0A0C9V094_SPHS4|nr:hypothetical protein M422DRAFT_51650 [Sphaerobolus stellatus SS14]
MGRDYFRGKALNWLKAKCPDFLQTPLKKRAKWCQSIADVFLAEFTDYPLPDENGKKIVRWFYNNAERQARSVGATQDTSNDKSKSVVPSHSKKLPTGLAALGIYDQAPTARVIYGEDHRATINQLATKRRATTQQGHLAHAGIWNLVLSAEWDNEQPSVRAHYEELARLEKQRMEGPLDATQLAQNQSRAPKALQEILQDMLGFERAQIGDAIIHVQLAYLNGTNIESVSWVNRPAETLKMVMDLTKMPEYTTTFSKPWTKYAHQVLEDLRLSREPLDASSDGSPPTLIPIYALTYDEEGCPLLPKLSSAFQGIDVILKEYLMKSWEHHWREQPISPALEWIRWKEIGSQLILPICIPPNVESAVFYMLISTTSNNAALKMANNKFFFVEYPKLLSCITAPRQHISEVVSGAAKEDVAVPLASSVTIVPTSCNIMASQQQITEVVSDEKLANNTNGLTLISPPFQDLHEDVQNIQTVVPGPGKNKRKQQDLSEGTQVIENVAPEPCRSRRKQQEQTTVEVNNSATGMPVAMSEKGTGRGRGHGRGRGRGRSHASGTRGGWGGGKGGKDSAIDSMPASAEMDVTT